MAQTLCIMTQPVVPDPGSCSAARTTLKQIEALNDKAEASVGVARERACEAEAKEDLEQRKIRVKAAKALKRALSMLRKARKKSKPLFKTPCGPEVDSSLSERNDQIGALYTIVKQSLRDRQDEIFPSCCGNGSVDGNMGEQCDAGVSNSNTEPNMCRGDCTRPRCGDGVIDAGEGCDRENFGGDTCEKEGFGSGTLTCTEDCKVDTGRCRSAECGDGIVGRGEECDHGPGNSDTIRDACRTNCKEAGCGDGVMDSGEQCDAKDVPTCESLGLPGVIPSCRADCTVDVSPCVKPICGNGKLDPAEECDEPNAPVTSSCYCCRDTPPPPPEHPEQAEGTACSFCHESKGPRLPPVICESVSNGEGEVPDCVCR
jgi:hypothetical protein